MVNESVETGTTRKARVPLPRGVVIGFELAFFPGAFLTYSAYSSNDPSGLQYIALVLGAGWALFVLLFLLICAIGMTIPARLPLIGLGVLLVAGLPQLSTLGYAGILDILGVIGSIILMLLTVRGIFLAVWNRFGPKGARD